MPALRPLLPVLLLAAAFAGCADGGTDVDPPGFAEATWLPVVHVAGALAPAGGAAGGATVEGDGTPACPEAFRYGFDALDRTLLRWADPGLYVGMEHAGVLAFAVDVQGAGCENPYGLQALEPGGAPRMVTARVQVDLPVEVQESALVLQNRTYPEGRAAALPVDEDGFVGTLLLTHLGVWRVETVPEKTPLPGDHEVWRTRPHPREQAFHLATLDGLLQEEPPQTFQHACGRPLYTFQVDLARHEVRRLRGHHGDLDDADLVYVDASEREPPPPCWWAQLRAGAGDPLRLSPQGFDGRAPARVVPAHPYLFVLDDRPLAAGDAVDWPVSVAAGDRTYEGTLRVTYHGVWTRHDVRTVASEDGVFGEPEGEA